MILDVDSATSSSLVCCVVVVRQEEREGWMSNYTRLDQKVYASACGSRVSAAPQDRALNSGETRARHTRHTINAA